MLKDVISAGGAGILIPSVLFVLLLYAARGLFGLHGRKSQHRLEFLQHWNQERIDDDLWLEVTIRHLYGSTLPAHVIRTALEAPHSSQALIELSDLWPFFQYAPDTQTVSWKHLRHRHPVFRRLCFYRPFALYLLLASVAFAMGCMAVLAQGISQWIFAIAAMIVGVCAFIRIWEEDAEKNAARVGEAWMNRINSKGMVIDVSEKHAP
jgi:hypothetical protein